MVAMQARLALMCGWLVLAFVPACDPVCELTTQLTVTDAAETPIPAAVVRETNTYSCCGSNDCTRMTDAAGVATFVSSSLRGSAACELVVEKPGFQSATLPYTQECKEPPGSITTVLRAVLTPTP